MTRGELTEAAEALRRAAQRAANDESRDRLKAQADQFDNLAEADRGPDHGRLARHEHILTEIADEDDAAAAEIETALESIRAYRQTVEGV
jgi:predicted glycosyl hydrolase (DUF1957 family)